MKMGQCGPIPTQNGCLCDIFVFQSEKYGAQIFFKFLVFLSFFHNRRVLATAITIRLISGMQPFLKTISLPNILATLGDSIVVIKFSDFSFYTDCSGFKIRARSYRVGWQFSHVNMEGG